MNDPLLGLTVLGRYRIVQTLASGGMGAIYLGRTEGAEGFARPVVIKRVLPALMGDTEVVQLFVREARILAELRHPNIVDVLDFGQQADGSYVTVFEYVNGYSLAQWCRFLERKRERMPIEAALHIVGRVLAALEHAHALRRVDGKQLQVIHRDVSPSNVLLSDQGTVKLLDFGIAQVSGDELGEHPERHRVRGKLPYMPLEIFRGEPATVQSDLYSAGLVLYELITGTNPFVAREAADVFHKVATVTPPSVHALRDDAPEELDAVFARALDTDAKQRFRSSAEFAEALRAMRRMPEDVVARQLAERLRRDFASALPKALDLEPLAAREAAWRNAELSVVESDIAVTARPPRGPDRPVRVSAEPSSYEAVTVHADVSPSLLGMTRDADEGSAPARPAPARVSRVAVIAGVSSLLGALAAGLVWLAVDREEPQPLVVIERHAPAAPMIEPAAPAVPAQAQAAALTATLPEAQPAPPGVAAQAAAPEPAAVPPVEKPEPSAPNPRALTRAFERRERQVETCFNRHAAALQGQPQLSLHFRVGASGDVLGVELEPAPLAATSLGQCLLDVARTTRFTPQQREISFHIPITAQTGHGEP